MFSNIGLTLVDFAVHIYTLLVLLRLLLQMAKADFYNPISQFIVKATNPLLLPLRKFIPGFFGIDTAALVLATIVQIVGLILSELLASGGISGNPILYLLLGVFGVISVLVSFYFFAIIILVIISWVAPGNYHPGAQLLSQVTEPIIRPIRNLLPSAGGLDFSPMVAMLIIFILQNDVLPAIKISLLKLFI